MKKYFFLKTEQEEQDYRLDPVRLRLITYQILDEIAKEKYYYGFNEYSLFAAIYAYLK